MVGTPLGMSARAASMAAAAMSARITMPAPPPAGVSSTERCLSVAKSRMSMVASAHLPSPSALPARLEPSGPGNISGKMVRTVACQVMEDPNASADGSPSIEQAFRGDHSEPTTLDVDLRYCLPGEGHQERGPADCRPDFQ